MLGTIVNAAAIIIGGALGLLIKKGFTKKVVLYGSLAFVLAGIITYVGTAITKPTIKYEILLISIGILFLWLLLGFLLKKGLPERFSKIIMQALGLAVIVVGITMAIESNDMLLVIISLVLGAVIGQALNIELKMEKVGEFAEKKLAKNDDKLFARGFVSSSLIYCVGAMAITGALQSGLSGEHSILFAKSALDGVSAIIFASAMGAGVIFSFVPVLIYQGLITTMSTFVAPLLTQSIINEMSAVGGCLIIAIGLNLLEIKKIKIGNMLPSIFIPLLYYVIKMLLGQVFTIF